jgi:hypothetical protein
MSGNGWIGVDLDGTLAHYEGWKGELHIGAPVPAMVERVQRWISEGREVKIFTARVSGPDGDAEEIRKTIEMWAIEHVGHRLEVTCMKDYAMIELWDDRAVGVEANTGRPLNPSTRGL